MNNQTLKEAAIIFCFGLITFIGSFLIQHTPSEHTIQGKPIFGEGSKNFEQIEEIKIADAKQQIAMEKNNGLWNLREADGYYVDNSQMHTLINYIKNGKILTQATLSQQQAEKYFSLNTVKVTLLNENKDMVSTVEIGEKLPNTNRSYAKIKGLKGYYLIENSIDFSLSSYKWIQQPLLSLASTRIEKITKDGKELQDTQEIIKALQLVPIQAVSSAQNFDETLYPDKTTIQITTKEGIKIDLTIYENKEEYWAKQKISSTALPTQAAKTYIKDNAFLYEYWYFRIPKTIGENLFYRQ